MFPVTVTIHNPGQLNAVLSALQATNPLTAADFADPTVGKAFEAAAAKVEANEKKEGAKPGKPAATTAATKPGAAADPTLAADALAKKDADSAKALGVEGEVATVTYEDVKKLILEVSKQKGRDAALKLLGEFGAEKGPDLQKAPEKFGPFVARAKALLS